MNPISSEELRQAFRSDYKSGAFHHRYGEKVIKPCVRVRMSEDNYYESED